MGDVFFKRAHLAVAPLSLNMRRAKYVNFLPALEVFYTGIYIPNFDASHEIDWKTFISPFRFDLWIMIIVSTITVTILKLILLGKHCGKSKNSIAILDAICFLWTSFTANFGGKPTPTKIDKTTTYKIVVITSLLSGLVIWMAYRSMLIAVFSILYQKYPFSDIESFSNTDWRYIHRY